VERIEQSGFATLRRAAFAPAHGRRRKTAAAQALAIGRTTPYRYLAGDPVPGDVRAWLAARAYQPSPPVLMPAHVPEQTA
jgi:hypothetical protein